MLACLWTSTHIYIHLYMPLYKRRWRTLRCLAVSVYSSEYGTGLISVQEDCMIFSAGLWFLISMDSTIFSSATSLQIFRIEIVREEWSILLSEWYFLKCSLKGVFLVLFLASLTCSLNGSLTAGLLAHRLQTIIYTVFFK